MTRWRVALGAALALCACGRGSTVGSGTVARDGGQRGCDRVTIRLLGAAQGTVSMLRLTVAGVTATGRDGAPVAVTDAACGRTVDVSTDLVAHDLGALPFREDGEDVDVSLAFSGGDACRGGHAGALEGCLSPLTFRYEPARVSPERCQVEVLLDVGRSVVEDGDGLAFLPDLRVVY